MLICERALIREWTLIQGNMVINYFKLVLGVLLCTFGNCV